MEQAIPVWTDLSGESRLAYGDFGTLFHRGGGAPMGVRLWNSLGAEASPAMTAVTLHAIGLDEQTQALIAAGVVQVWQEEAWETLSEPVPLPDLAHGEGIVLWLRIALPVEAGTMDTARLQGELRVEWV